jgi:hypothetical protein
MEKYWIRDFGINVPLVNFPFLYHSERLRLDVFNVETLARCACGCESWFQY